MPFLKSNRPKRSLNPIIKRLIAIPQSFNGIVHFGDDACIARHTTFSPARLSETLTLFDRMADHAV